MSLDLILSLLKDAVVIYFMIIAWNLMMSAWSIAASLRKIANRKE